MYSMAAAGSDDIHRIVKVYGMKWCWVLVPHAYMRVWGHKSLFSSTTKLKGGYYILLWNVKRKTENDYVLICWTYFLFNISILEAMLHILADVYFDSAFKSIIIPNDISNVI